MALDEARYEALLLERRREVEALIASAAEGTRAVELDQTRVGRLSRMDAMQGQAMAQETERRRQLELKRIDAALARMADGEYGACVVCGGDIPEKRLVLDPAATVCVDCAQR